MSSVKKEDKTIPDSPAVIHQTIFPFLPFLLQSEMEEEIVCNRWRDLAGDSFLLLLYFKVKEEAIKKESVHQPGKLDIVAAISSLFLLFFNELRKRRGKI